MVIRSHTTIQANNNAQSHSVTFVRDEWRSQEKKSMIWNPLDIAAITYKPCNLTDSTIKKLLVGVLSVSHTITY
mgnify:CR=1 FL=1